MTTKTKKTETKPISETAKTIEDVYKALGFDITTKRPYANPADQWEEYLNACADEKAIKLFYNNGEDVTYGKWGYVPVFRKHDHPSGFGFSFVVSDWTVSVSNVGSRAFVRYDDAEKAGKQFESIYSIIHRYDN